MGKLIIDKLITEPIKNVKVIESPTNDEYIKMSESSNELLRSKVQHSIDCNILFKD